MKKYLLKLTLGIVASFAGITTNAQCPAITCPSNITVNNDAGNCDAVVNFTAPIGNDPCTTGSQTFTFTGALQTWVVPAGVTSVTVDMSGAQGGGTLGGNGGRAQGVLTVTPGQTLNIHVGGKPTAQLGPGGYNGGGATTVLPCGPNASNGFPGGGASDIRIGGNTLNDRVVVAGGGGGQGWSNGLGGSGGGNVGGDGDPSWIAGTHGKGGTQSAGGIGGFYTGNSQSSPSGTFGVGGNSGPVNTYCTGGAGGGGWYGGGAGYVSAGAGGSSYITGLASASTTSGTQTGNGQVTINYAGVPVTTTQTAGLASGSAFPVGTTTNTFSATNGFGTVTCSFTVTVVDAENPTVSCPGPVTINTDAGQCTSTASIGIATGTDNCAAPTITSNAPVSFPIGNTTVTWTSTDASSNSVTCTQVVTVVDAENPIITCPANVGSCDSVVTGLAPTSSDNCTGATVAYTLTGATTGAGTVDASGSTFGVGITTVQYTVTDGSSNQATCSFTVEVFAPLTGTVANAICAGDSMVINGTTYNAGNPTGTEVFTNVGPNMCDSTVTVNLTINPLPTVAIAAFTPDTVCDSDPAINLPAGTPTAGTYSGTGVVGTTFDPNTAGVGAHYVMYSFTDSNTCTNMDSTMIVVISCVGVDENGALAGVNIYPNPTNNIINITLGNITADVNLTLTSVEGKIVYQENNVSDNKVSVDLSNNSKGIYFLKVEANNQYKVYKVIKE